MPMTRPAWPLILLALLGALSGCGESAFELDLEPAFEPGGLTVEGSLTSACPALARKAVVAVGDDGRGHPATNAADGSLTTYWSHWGQGSWLQVDLGASTDVAGFGVAWYRGHLRTAQFSVALSEDGQAFAPAYSGQSNGRIQVETFAKRKARYVRLIVNGSTESDWATVYELTACGGAAVGGSGGTLDEEGVQMLNATNPQGSAWRLGSKDPNSDPELEVDGEGNASRTEDFWTARPREGGLASGGTQLTLRLHVNVSASNGKQATSHSTMAQQGYMVSPRDLRNLEMTGYFRVRASRGDDTLSMKVRGGSHTDSSPSSSACIGVLAQFSGQGSQLWEKELFHPKTPKYGVNKLVEYGSLRDRWVGVKAVVFNVAGNTQAVSQLWVDSDPFDAAGKPRNGWKRVYEYVDSAGTPVTWGGKYETWRIDEAGAVDFKLLSVREIVPPRS
jgi:hypothetical protein